MKQALLYIQQMFCRHRRLDYLKGHSAWCLDCGKVVSIGDLYEGKPIKTTEVKRKISEGLLYILAGIIIVGLAVISYKYFLRGCKE